MLKHTCVGALFLVACGSSQGSSSGDDSGTTVMPGTDGSSSNDGAMMMPGDAGPDVMLPPPSGAPYVLYTDIASGPSTGGENGKGAYLSIFGINFGPNGLGTTVKVFIGNAEVG